MKRLTEVYSVFTRKVGSTKLKFILFLLAVALYVLGSGAPEAGGGIINAGSIFRFQRQTGMILLVAVAAGLSAGYIRSSLAKRPYQSIQLRFVGLVFVSLSIQWLLFSVHATRTRIPDGIGSSLFVISQFMLLFFAWKNWKIPGFWLLALGLLLNLSVIVANGGWMPITPETVTWLNPNAPPGSWHVGARLATGKDIVLMAESTRLWILSDQIRSPGWLPYRVAFSFGDGLIAAGAFWVFWALGGADGHSYNKDIEQ